MKTEKFSGTIENAYGQQLPAPVKFEGQFDAFETYAEIQAANELPSNDEVVSFVNTRRKNNARQKAMTQALEAAGIVKPTLETSPELRLKTIKDALVAAGKSEAEAEAIAKASLGV